MCSENRPCLKCKQQTPQFPLAGRFVVEILEWLGLGDADPGWEITEGWVCARCHQPILTITPQETPPGNWIAKAGGRGSAIP